MSPKRILVSGYYGFSNIGDEAILLSLHHALKGEIPDVEITVLSGTPRATRRDHGLNAISRRNLPLILYTLRRSDLLISGGGSLFQDLTSNRSLYLYLFTIFLALVARCPVMIYAQGIGPLRSRFNRRLTGILLRRVALITVRDEHSLEELRDLGVTDVDVPQFLTADPVMVLQLPSEKALLPGDGSRPRIGVSIRPWRGADHLLTELSKALLRLIEERGAQIYLFPMHYPGDDQITEELRQRLDAPEKVFVMPTGYRVEQVIASMAELDLFIGVRLHALVFAAIASTPAIAVSYDPKVDQFAKRMEQVSAGAIESVTAQRLWEAACSQLDDQARIRERTRALSETLRKEALKTATFTAELLRTTPYEE